MIILYLLPLGKKPEFIQQNGQIVAISKTSPILKSIYPEGIYASCGANRTGTNCQTGCCSAGQRVVCDPPPGPSPPSISASLNCSNPGTNGWCIGLLTLNLSTSDPQGASFIISTVISGVQYECDSNVPSCSFSITDQGTGLISYRVDVSTGKYKDGSIGYQLDVSTPNLSASVSGTPGTSPWYVSNATLSASANDSVSGIVALETNTGGGGWTSYSPLTITDGVHAVLVRAIDNAGNVSQTSRVIHVDTITPSWSLSTSGTKGKDSWYVSTASVTPNASDSGSGIAAVEASIDGGGWSSAGLISFSDGVPHYQYRAIDNAGNVTTTPLQYLNVDITAPSIELSQGTSLGQPMHYKIVDDGSELSIYRAVIEENSDEYKKVVWAGNLHGKVIQDQILWGGKFSDGTKAGSGDHMITMTITDAAGNKSTATSYIHVNLLSLLQDLSGSTAPSTAEPDTTAQTDSQPEAQTDNVVFECHCIISQIEIQSLDAHQYPQKPDPVLGETSRQPDSINALV